MGILDTWLGKRSDASPRLRYPQSARLYEYRTSLIVCSQNAEWETEALTKLDNSVGDAEIGDAVLKHLRDFRPDVDANPGKKLTDWPAYKVSGAKSVKAFERELWQVQLHIMNSAVLVSAQPRLTLNDFRLSSSTMADRSQPAQVGSAVRQAIAAAKVLREQGVV
jgi:hypothetical protein